MFTRQSLNQHSNRSWQLEILLYCWWKLIKSTALTTIRNLGILVEVNRFNYNLKRCSRWNSNPWLNPWSEGQIHNVFPVFKRYLIRILSHPRPLFNLFSSFQTNILQQLNLKKCPFGMQSRDSNPQHLEHESPPITTRPGLLLFFDALSLFMH